RTALASENKPAETAEPSDPFAWDSNPDLVYGVRLRNKMSRARAVQLSWRVLDKISALLADASAARSKKRPWEPAERRADELFSRGRWRAAAAKFGEARDAARNYLEKVVSDPDPNPANRGEIEFATKQRSETTVRLWVKTVLCLQKDRQGEK